MENPPREKTTTWPLLLLLVLFLGLYAYSLLRRTGPSAYTRRAVNGVVDTIYKYDKSFPVVRIRGERLTLDVPTGCSQYLRAGDSVSKAAQSNRIQTVRDNGQYRECITWGYSADGDSADIDGFISSVPLPR